MPADILDDLAKALQLHGLIVRGGFYPQAGEVGLEGAGTLVMIGNAGPAMWDAFAPDIGAEPNPLDRWTAQVVDPLAARFGAWALYPFRPHPETGYRPFQRWAQRAESVHPSPLGILIHPRFGLWHAYRAALLFPSRLDLPEREEAASPCEACVERPCLGACPVQAFDGIAYDVAACAAYIASPAVQCHASGCLARGACPVGAEWRYPDAQVRFHMAAFTRSVVPRSAVGG